jgi:hypothetical protein
VWGLAFNSGIRHAAAGRHTLNLPGLWIKPTGIRRVFVWSFVITYGKILISAKKRMSSSRGGNKMSVLNLEDVIVEAAVELAISGECDVPVDNNFGGCDISLPGTNSGFLKGSFVNGVRFAVEDGSIHIFKFQGFGVAAVATFKGEMVSSSILVAIAKEWL